MISGINGNCLNYWQVLRHLNMGIILATKATVTYSLYIVGKKYAFFLICPMFIPDHMKLYLEF